MISMYFITMMLVVSHSDFKLRLKGIKFPIYSWLMLFRPFSAKFLIAFLSTQRDGRIEQGFSTIVLRNPRNTYVLIS